MVNRQTICCWFKYLPCARIVDPFRSRARRCWLHPSRASLRPVTARLSVFVILIAFSAGGCETASSTGDEHEHSHHHERTPTFAESVNAIRHRSTRFMSRHAIEADSLDARKLQQLVEVVEKLPEVASDSDLKKADWDRVNTISQQLKELLQPASFTSNDTASATVDRLKSLISELERLTRTSESR